MKCVLAAVCALLCLVALGGCETYKPLDLPEIKQLKLDMIAAAPSIRDIEVTYGDLSKHPAIIVRGYKITDEDALSIVKRARNLFSDEGFYDKLFKTMGTIPKEEFRAGYRPAPPISITMMDSAWVPETFSGHKYSFDSRYFVTEENGAEGDVVDGYSTWWGGRVSDNDENCKAFSMEEILAAD